MFDSLKFIHSMAPAAMLLATAHSLLAQPYLKEMVSDTDQGGVFVRFYLHNLFVDDKNNLYSSGSNAYGQLGDGSTADRHVAALIGKSYVAVAKSSSSSAGLMADGSLWTWGENFIGELGNGTFGGQQTISSKIGDGFKSIAGGGYGNSSRFFAIKTDNSLWAWGGGEGSVLGVGNSFNLNVPTKIGDDFHKISVGPAHTLGLKRDGSVWGWGDDRKGRLANAGRGEGVDTTKPVRIDEGYIEIAAGTAHSAGIKRDGSLWTWGYGWAGGTELLGVNETPRKVGEGFVAIKADAGLNVALNNQGELFMWGDGASSTSVSGKNPEVAQFPMKIGDDFATLLDVAGGLKKDGSLWFWGKSQAPATGALNDNSSGGLARSRPTQVASAISAVSAENKYVVAVDDQGRLLAWGNNRDGQLGDGTTQTRYRPVVIGEGFANVSTAPTFAFALKPDGSLWSWGDNTYGQLGLGDRQARSKPTPVANHRFRSVSAGDFHGLGIGDDLSLWAWGDNQYGRLGNGIELDQPTPVQVGQDFVAVKALGRGSIGIKRDGSVWIWGSWQATEINSEEAPCNRRRAAIQYLVPTRICDGVQFLEDADFRLALLKTKLSRAADAQKNTPQAPRFIKEVLWETDPGRSFVHYFLAEDGSIWRLRHGGTVGSDAVIATLLYQGPFTDLSVDSENNAFIDRNHGLWIIGRTNDGQIPIPGIPYFTVPRHSVVLDPPATQQAVCLFDWAQVVYPTLFAPPGNLHESSTASGASYLFRAFPGTQSFLGVADGVLYYLGPASNNTIARIGLVADWLERAACD